MLLTNICLALLLPWFSGTIWVYFLVGRSAYWNRSLVVGHGFLFGMFLTGMILRCSDLLQLPLNFWSTAAALLVLSIPGLYLIHRNPPSHRPISSATPLQLWQRAAVILLLMLICGRYLLLAQELALRPLFAWDAFMNWVPKAVVWYQQNEITAFVSPNAWLALPAEDTSYTLGNNRSWNYPHTVPLIQLWGMLAVGSSDHPLVFLPWLVIVLSAGLSIYGHLRLAGSPVVTATLACYVFLNMPYVNVHSVLPGYADIWLAVAFGQACMALHAWQQSGHWSHALLALLMAAICATLKTPGLVLGGIILVVIIYCQLNLSRKQLLSVGTALAVIGSYIFFIGIRVDLPFLGTVSLSSDSIQLPLIGQFKLLFHPVHEAIGKSLFTMSNWNIWWPAFFLTLAHTVITRKNIQAGYPAGLAILLCTAFIIFTFNFTKHFWSAENFTTLNRAILYMMPALVFYTFTLLSAHIVNKEENNLHPHIASPTP